MLYLSQLVNKKIYCENKPCGKVVDLLVSKNSGLPLISKILIKTKEGKKIISSDKIIFNTDIRIWESAKKNHRTSALDKEDLLLVEDLLDKQVIDVNGRRLVRVNDILLNQIDGCQRIDGIDIGFAGILRRLFVPEFYKLKTLVLPWSVIQAFDYETGNIQIRLAQSNLDKLHPAELADILEDAGTKERLGIIKALNPHKAASAIEEADEETQSAILEDVSGGDLKKIVEKMKISEIADIIGEIKLNRRNQIYETIGAEKAEKLRKLLKYKDEVAGGLMDVSFEVFREDAKIAKIIKSLGRLGKIPEVVFIVGKNNRLVGAIMTRNLLRYNLKELAKNCLKDRHFVFVHANFDEILVLFAQYNLRSLAVCDSQEKLIGSISVDSILGILAEEEVKNDAL